MAVVFSWSFFFFFVTFRAAFLCMTKRNSFCYPSDTARGDMCPKLCLGRWTSMSKRNAYVYLEGDCRKSLHKKRRVDASKNLPYGRKNLQKEFEFEIQGTFCFSRSRIPIRVNSTYFLILIARMKNGISSAFKWTRTYLDICGISVHIR